MKTNKIYLIAVVLMLSAGCVKEHGDTAADCPCLSIPEGFFEVSFSAGKTTSAKAAVAGPDGRIRHLRYIIYKATGEYVKERIVWRQGIPSWPMASVKDTLPNGDYVAVFLGNMEKTLFPYGSPTAYNDVLTDYQSSYADARIVLPNAAFEADTEYYWAKVSFSDQNPQPNVLLQRMIGAAVVHRNFIDAQEALNKLVFNIMAQKDYHDVIRTGVQGQLPVLLNTGILGALLSRLNSGISRVAGTLVAPVTNALYDALAEKLTDQIGMALTGNTDRQGMLAAVGGLLNPWAGTDANAAIVTINNFPKTVDFDLNVKEVHTGDKNFRYDFDNTVAYQEKDISIKGFAGNWDIRKINVIKHGLVAGLLVDDAADGLLLQGAFVDINDPLSLAVPANRRYKNNYSFVDLKLKSYDDDASQSGLNLQIRLGDIANLSDALANIPVIGTLLSDTIMDLIADITVSASVTLPVVDVDNLELSGGWDAPVSY